MYCYKCGQRIPDDSRFCYKCGSNLESTSHYSETVASKAEESGKNSNPFEVKLSSLDSSLANNKRVFQIGIGISFIFLLILFFTDWFRMPIVSLFSEKVSSFSVIDIVKVLYKTGSIFEFGGKTLEKVVEAVPFYVKAIAVIIVATYYISIILLLISAIRMFIAKPRKNTLIGSLITSLICVLTSFVVISYLKNKIDEISDDFFGSGIVIGFSKSFYVLLISLILVLALICYFNSKYKDVRVIVDESGTGSLADLFYKSAIFKPFCIVLLVALIIFVGVLIYRYVDKNKFHSAEDYYTGGICLDSIDGIECYATTTELSEKASDRYYKEEFHLDKADGIYTLWCSEAVKDESWPVGAALKRIDGCYYMELSEKADISLYLLYPDQTCEILPVYSDNRPVMSGNIESYIGVNTTEEGLEYYTDPLYGYYRIVMVAHEVEDVDVLFSYANNYDDDNNYDFKLYYPGNFRNYDIYEKVTSAYVSERETSDYDSISRAFSSDAGNTERDEQEALGNEPALIGRTKLKAHIAHDSTNIRSGPSTESDVIDKLSKGTKLTIDEIYKDENEIVWCKISYDGVREGYVRSDMIIDDTNEESENPSDSELSDEEIRAIFKESVSSFFDLNDIKSVFFTDINRDGTFECCVNSFSNGDAIFYLSGDEVIRFSDDIGGTETFAFIPEKNLVIKDYCVGTRNGVLFYTFDEWGFTQLDSVLYDEMEDKYYINDQETTEDESESYLSDMTQNAIFYDGSDNYDSAPVYR